ncbi:MAG: response regulator [candidate division Zixibacteria bacterium]|nr:response regulator [candidate division Zixibacteria bacterium]NIT54183.1 response regulator [candidate division Zixibacteria bacterium]NIW42688.1 response regulator [candidate division Zixibacteria bacterium]NIX57049.1 response regulator [candidate division Zixibacteria bacterium]
MGEKIKLLICDDEIKFLDSIAERLELRGFDVTKATSGNEAVEAARTGGFDLAILDLKMPGMNGIEVLEILKKEHRYLEVIILTGHGSIDSAVESTKLGAFSYLSKPYDLDDLLKSLKDAYETRMKKKFEDDTERMDKILKMAQSMSPLGFLREVKKLDDEEK